MADKRRVNGPSSGTSVASFTASKPERKRGQRTRKPNQLRKIYLETGVVPTASGSAYLELEGLGISLPLLDSALSSLKISCAVHGPKPVPRNANFSSNLQLNVSVKFAPFATRQRRGYIRDSIERDIGTHVETALNGVIIPDRWPKSALDVVITVLEADDDGDDEPQPERQQNPAIEGLGNMNVVSGCITAASAALCDARIDCLGLLTGGVAATTCNHSGKTIKMLDPSPSEEPSPSSACVVAYMSARDEVTLVWAKGDIQSSDDERVRSFDSLLDSAINAARGSHAVLKQVVADLHEDRYHP